MTRGLDDREDGMSTVKRVIPLEALLEESAPWVLLASEEAARKILLRLYAGPRA